MTEVHRPRAMLMSASWVLRRSSMRPTAGVRGPISTASIVGPARDASNRRGGARCRCCHRRVDLRHRHVCSDCFAAVRSPRRRDALLGPALRRHERHERRSHRHGCPDRRLPQLRRSNLWSDDNQQPCCDGQRPRRGPQRLPRATTSEVQVLLPIGTRITGTVTASGRTALSGVCVFAYGAENRNRGLTAADCTRSVRPPTLVRRAARSSLSHRKRPGPASTVDREMRRALMTLVPPTSFAVIKSSYAVSFASEGHEALVAVAWRAARLRMRRRRCRGTCYGSPRRLACGHFGVIAPVEPRLEVLSW